MKTSKTKVRTELRRTTDNLRDSGTSFKQSLAVAAFANALIVAHLSIESPDELKDLVLSVLRESYGIEREEG